VGKKELSYMADLNVNEYNHYGKQYEGSFKKLKIELSYDPAITLLEIYPKECDSGYNKSTCTPMFIAALFSISKLWKQLRCPITDELIENMQYLYTMEFHSAIKKNEILSFTGKWKELKIIISCEVSQVKKAKGCIFSLISGIQN
jgi:hypothetical protein